MKTMKQMKKLETKIYFDWTPTEVSNEKTKVSGKAVRG